jgi:hypothetical protein
MAWWQLGRHREPAAEAARATPPVIGSAEPDGAWRDLPTLQRTLADPLQPVAVTDDFRDSLASYADPSFVAPLAHQVNPEAGGLVEGLVAPGMPYSHAGGSVLAVPPRSRPATTRTLGRSTGSAQNDGPLVQRSSIPDSSADLHTVALELPGIRSPMLDSDPSAAAAGSADPTEVALPPETSTRGDTPASRPTLSAEASPVEGAEARDRVFTETSVSDHGVQLAASATRSRELPVVARSADRWVDSEVPRPIHGSAGVAASSAQPTPATGSTDLPLVSRSAEPAAESAPLSGFAEAITRLNEPSEFPTDSREVFSDDHASSSDDHVSSVDHHASRKDDHPARSEVPAVSVPIPRIATEGHSRSEPRALPKAPAAPPPKAPDGSLPVVSRRADPGSTIAVETGYSQIETRSNAPTLGGWLTETPLALQRAPITDRVSAPVEPPVQRVEFVRPQITLTRRAEAASAPSSPAATPASTPEAPRTPPPVTPTTQRLLPQDGKQVSNAPIRPALAISRRETPVEDRRPATPNSETAPQNVAAEFSMQRLEPVAPPHASQPVAPTTLSVPWRLPLVMRTHREVDAVVHDRQEGPAASDLPAASAEPDVPIGPAVVAERWTSATSTAMAGSAAAALEASLPTASRLPANAPAQPTSRSGGSNSIVVVGPPIPLQRATAVTARTVDPTSSPLIVSRQVAVHASSTESRHSGGMSFAQMFGSASESESGSPAEDGFTTVQLQSAEEPTPPPSEPAADTSSAPPATTSAPLQGAGASSVELDEMARRLYEPLTARLRAELWLDRERAGVTSDV